MEQAKYYREYTDEGTSYVKTDDYWTTLIYISNYGEEFVIKKSRGKRSYSSEDVIETSAKEFNDAADKIIGLCNHEKIC